MQPLCGPQRLIYDNTMQFNLVRASQTKRNGSGALTLQTASTRKARTGQRLLMFLQLFIRPALPCPKILNVEARELPHGGCATSLFPTAHQPPRLSLSFRGLSHIHSSSELFIHKHSQGTSFSNSRQAMYQDLSARFHESFALQTTLAPCATNSLFKERSKGLQSNPDMRLAEKSLEAHATCSCSCTYFPVHPVPASPKRFRE